MGKVKKLASINIKTEHINGHLGATKITNDDWGTIAYSIPRNEVQMKFMDKELRYNFIYFLFGYEGLKEIVYVGQAKKRNNGESVLERLREHDRSNTERYRDKWSWVVAVTNKDDKWTLDDLNALENAFYNEIPTSQNLNGNNPNSGGADYSGYEDKIKQIKLYITTIGFNIFYDKDTDDRIVVTQEIENNSVYDIQYGLSDIPEITTPHKVVREMVDALPLNVWNNKTVFLDPACKGGEYLREVYDRLMDCEILQSEFPNNIERSNHILKNQIYGIALSDLSLRRTSRKLLGFDINIKVIPKYLDILKHLCYMDNKNEAQRTLLEILKGQFKKDMKIDVVIGNPPYQKINGQMNTGSLASGESIYQYFIESGIMASDVVCMITPTKWFAGNKKLNKVRELLLSGNHINQMHIIDAQKTFHIIMDRVVFFCYDVNYNGETNIVDEVNNDNNDRRYIGNNNIDCFILNRLDNTIVKKVLETSGEEWKGLEAKIQPQNTFGLITSTRGSEMKAQDNDVIMHYTGYKCPGDNTCYISRNTIIKNKEFIDRYKVIYAHGCGSKSNVITRVLYAGKGEVCTQSYIVVGPVDTEEIARNIEKYIKTKFVRVLVRVRLVDQHLDADRFRFVPLQDFTSKSDINWVENIDEIDKQMYKKYKLSDEEINYIEDTINSME